MYTISVVITTFNRYNYLINAIRSIEMQDYSNIEIIVVDDNSSDTEYEKLYYHNEINYIKNKANLGASESRKIGYAVAKGEYIVFMDDDDYYTDPSFFSKSIEVFKQKSSKKIAFVSGNADLLIEKNYLINKGNRLDFVGRIDNIKYLLGFQFKYMKPYSTFTSIFNKEIIDIIIPETSMFNDSTIYIKCLLYGDAWFLKEVIGIYRIHENNISKTIDLQFLIDNMSEKEKAANEFSRIAHIDNAYWLYEQFLLTMNYYMIESKPNAKNCLLLLYWITKHISKKKYKIKLVIHWCKNIVYSIK